MHKLACLSLVKHRENICFILNDTIRTTFGLPCMKESPEIRIQCSIKVTLINCVPRYTVRFHPPISTVYRGFTVLIKCHVTIIATLYTLEGRDNFHALTIPLLAGKLSENF